MWNFVSSFLIHVIGSCFFGPEKGAGNLVPRAISVSSPMHHKGLGSQMHGLTYDMDPESCVPPEMGLRYHLKPLVSGFNFRISQKCWKLL